MLSHAEQTKAYIHLCSLQILYLFAELTSKNEFSNSVIPGKPWCIFSQKMLLERLWSGKITAGSSPLMRELTLSSANNLLLQDYGEEEAWTLGTISKHIKAKTEHIPESRKLPLQGDEKVDGNHF